MADYLVGTISATNLGISVSCLVQSLNWNFAYDESETRDEKGNVLIYQQYNHRAEGSVTARIPYGVQIPAQGASITIKGISLPSYSAAGVPTGGYTLDNTPSGDGVSFAITDASINTSNTEVAEWSLTVRRYLENGVGSQDTDTSDSL